VREDNEWAAAPALHLSKGIIERDIETKVPDKNATLVLYCGGGSAGSGGRGTAKMGYGE
jgi:hypothetical protein